MISKNHLEYSQNGIQLRNIKSQTTPERVWDDMKNLLVRHEGKGKTVAHCLFLKPRQVVATTAQARALLSLDNNNFRI